MKTDLAAAQSIGLQAAGKSLPITSGKNRNEPATKEDVPYLSVTNAPEMKTDVVARQARKTITALAAATAKEETRAREL